jgi:DNA-binding winged helix-turn-helix (wHTH) protein
MRFAFGPFQIDAVRRELFLDGKPLDLHPRKSIGALLILVQNKGHLVTKGLFMDTLWGQAAVEERSLNIAISILRKTLDPQLQGALGTDNSCIQTVHRRGFRFTVPVTEVSENVELDRLAPSSAREVSGPRRSPTALCPSSLPPQASSGPGSQRCR